MQPGALPEEALKDLIANSKIWIWTKFEPSEARESEDVA